MNIANKLTLFRIFLVPIFIASLLILGINNILGFFIFNEIPDIYSLIGYLLIVLSGFFINFIRK